MHLYCGRTSKTIRTASRRPVAPLLCGVVTGSDGARVRGRRAGWHVGKAKNLNVCEEKMIFVSLYDTRKHDSSTPCHKLKTFVPQDIEKSSF